MRPELESKLEELNLRWLDAKEELDRIDNEISLVYIEDHKENPPRQLVQPGLIQELYQGKIQEQLGQEAFLVQWGDTQLLTPKFRPQSKSIITNLSDN